MRIILVAVMMSTLFVGSCALAPSEKPQPVPAAPQATYPADLRGAQLYRIDAQASSVHILVYRGGAMAKTMGHNHVISAKNLAGYIWRTVALEGSGFSIVVPVNDLNVDDDDARAAEGSEFPANVDDAAKQGTRNNMLGEQLLNAARFPSITIESSSITGAMESAQVLAKIQIKDRTQEVTVPVTTRVGDNRLEVRGEFDIHQSDFGITPLSVAMGALTVQDSVKIRFALFASPIEP